MVVQIIRNVISQVGKNQFPNHAQIPDCENGLLVMINKKEAQCIVCKEIYNLEDISD